MKCYSLVGDLHVLRLYGTTTAKVLPSKVGKVLISIELIESLERFI